jgi:hypothetical protein
MNRRDYRRVQSANNVYDHRPTSESRWDGELYQDQDQEHLYRHKVIVSPASLRRRYGRVGSARSIRMPPPPPVRKIESESSNESLAISLDVESEDMDDVNLYGSKAYSGPMGVGNPQIRNGWNARKSHSASALNARDDLEAAHWSPAKGSPRSSAKGFKRGGTRKMYTKGGVGSMAPPVFGRRDSVGNASFSSVSLMGDSATPIQDSLTSMGSSSSTILGGPPQLLSPGNSELRWNACTSTNKSKHQELPPAFQGLTPPVRPRVSTTDSFDTMDIPPPLTEDDDTAEFSRSSDDYLDSDDDDDDDALIVDDRLPPAYQDAARNEHRRKSKAAKQGTKSLPVEPESKFLEPKNRLSDMQWDEQNNLTFSPEQTKEGFKHANSDDLPPAFKLVVSPTSGKKKALPISLEDEKKLAPSLTDAESNEVATESESAKSEMEDVVTRPELTKSESQEVGPNSVQVVEELPDGPVPSKRPWKVKRLVSVDSFNRRENEDDRAEESKQTVLLTEATQDVPTVGNEEEGSTDPETTLDPSEYSDSPTTARKSWHAKRIISVGSFNKKESSDQNQEVKQLEPAEEGTEMSDSPRPKTRSWKTKRVFSVDSFNKKQEQTEEESATIETVPPAQKVMEEETTEPESPEDKEQMDHVQKKDNVCANIEDDDPTEPETEDVTESSELGDTLEPSNRYYKVKRVISIDTFEQELGYETVESHHSGQDTCETQAEPKPINHYMHSEDGSTSQSRTGEETTESNNHTHSRASGATTTASTDNDRSALEEEPTEDELMFQYDEEASRKLYGYEYDNHYDVANKSDEDGDVTLKRRGSTGALAQLSDKRTNQAKSERKSSAAPEPRRKHKRRGSTGALVSLFEEKKKTKDEEISVVDTFSRRGSRTALVGLWEEKTTKPKDEEFASENSGRRGPRTALAKKWSQELLPLIRKPTSPEKTATSSIENVQAEDREEKFGLGQANDPAICIGKTKAKRRGSAGALARKWSQELLPTMAKAKLIDDSSALAAKESMARKREMRLKARASAAATDGATRPVKDGQTLSESAFRKKKIDEEMTRLVKHAEEVNLAGPIQSEVYSCLKKVVMKLTYTKKFYDVFKDEFIYFPTISHTMLDYTVFEEAEALYGEESNVLPIQYVAALRSAADYDIFKYCADLDIAYMENLAADVDVHDDKCHNETGNEEKSQAAEESHEEIVVRKSCPMTKESVGALTASISPDGSRFKVPSKAHAKLPEVKREITKVKSAASPKTSPKKIKKLLSVSCHTSTVDSVSPGFGAKRKTSKKDKLKGRYQRSNSTGAMAVRSESSNSRPEWDKLSKLLPPKKKKSSKTETSVDEAKSGERSRSRSREEKESASRRRSRSAGPLDEKKKSKGRSKSSGRSSDAKKKARQKAKPTYVGLLDEEKKPKQRGRSRSLELGMDTKKKRSSSKSAMDSSKRSSSKGPLDEKKKPKQRGRSRSLEPEMDTKKKRSSSKSAMDSSKRSSSKGTVDEKAKAKKRSSSVGAVDRKKSAPKKRSSVDSASCHQRSTSSAFGRIKKPIKKSVVKSKSSTPDASNPSSDGVSVVSPKAKSKAKVGSSSISLNVPKSKPKQADFSSSMRFLLGASEGAGAV